jgi:aspartyl-tRNA(Asn)/glutamyl-tRNA(Gln) amidotransferase subunit C
MAITREEVLRIAELARLQFSERELEAFTAQFQRILEYVEKLKEIDIEGVEPTSHVFSEAAGEGLRADTAIPSLPTAEALKNAPDPGQDHFRVPGVLNQ